MIEWHLWDGLMTPVSRTRSCRRPAVLSDADPRSVDYTCIERALDAMLSVGNGLGT